MNIISAGGVVYKIENDVVYVKLITTKAWKYSLPKGRIENNEDMEACAIREVLEESGVEANIETFLGTAEWKIKNDKKTVYIYLMKTIKDGQPNDPDNEIIKCEWKSINEAIKLVENPPMRKLLIYAAKYLDATKLHLCVNCFEVPSALLDWCEECLSFGKKQAEKKIFKEALEKKK